MIKALFNFVDWLQQPCITKNGTEWLYTNHAGAIFVGLILAFCIALCFSKKLRNIFF